jgi:hypothetical protein
MNKRSVLILAVGVTALLVAGGLFASNMGFKLNYTLSGTGSSASGTNTLGLPFFRQTGLDDSLQLIQDIEQGNAALVTNVQRFLKASDGFELYDGTTPGTTPFPLAAAEGYFVKMGAANVNYIVVGSHDPGLTVTLNGTGSSASGTNFYSYPYHSTAANAEQLIADIEQGNPALVTNVQRFLKASDGFELYDGTTPGTTPFALTPGEAYFIKVGAADVAYVPSHY